MNRAGEVPGQPGIWSRELFASHSAGYPASMKTVLIVIVLLALAYGAYMLVARSRRT